MMVTVALCTCLSDQACCPVTASMHVSISLRRVVDLASDVLSSLPVFSLLFKSKAKKDIFKEMMGLNPFRSAFYTRRQQRVSSIFFFFFKENEIPF